MTKDRLAALVAVSIAPKIKKFANRFLVSENEWKQNFSPPFLRENFDLCGKSRRKRVECQLSH